MRVCQVFLYNSSHKTNTITKLISIILPSKHIHKTPHTKAAPHSPRRQKLNLRMKSLSLDSPESTELHGQMRRRYPAPGTSSMAYHSGSGGGLEHTPPSNNSRLHCTYMVNETWCVNENINTHLLSAPSSPSAHRKLLSANRNLRTGSVDLPDDMEKSLSSNSGSPCASPVRQGHVNAHSQHSTSAIASQVSQLEPFDKYPF